MARGDVRDDENRRQDRADEYWKPSAVLLSLQNALVPKFESPRFALGRDVSCGRSGMNRRISRRPNVEVSCWQLAFELGDGVAPVDVAGGLSSW